jgi:trans-aconitate 2-methyltransferase
VQAVVATIGGVVAWLVMVAAKVLDPMPKGSLPMVLQRVPEPELMDGAEQVAAYASADFEASDQAMVERLAHLCDDDPGPWLVDLGCGPGNISFRLARRWPAARVLGLDGAPRMLAIAEQRLVVEPELAGHLHFQQALLPLPESAPLPAGFSAGCFTALVSNSLLHHLHDPLGLWTSLAQLGAPGAFVYVQDLRRPPSAAAVEDLVATTMADAPEVLCRDYRASLHAAFTPAEVAAQLQQAGLGGLQVAPLGDCYLEVWGRLT